MAQVITFTVRGLPAPQGSKRAFRNKHSGRVALVESSKRVAPWRSDVRDAALAAVAAHPEHGQHSAAAFHTPVAVRLEFRMPRPKGHYGTGRNATVLKASAPTRPAGKPDVDKLARAVLDAITAIVIADDSQVTDLHASKVYADEHRGVGVEVRVTDLGELDRALEPSPDQLRTRRRWPPIETPAQALGFIDALWSGNPPTEGD